MFAPDGRNETYADRNINMGKFNLNDASRVDAMKRCIIYISVLLAACAVVSHAYAAQVMEEGAAGETVQVLTRRLAELGYISETVSEYGEDVISAIGDFQTANGLERTGIADLETQAAMNSEDAVIRGDYMTEFVGRYSGRSLSSGNSGDDVLGMQRELRELGYYDYEPDGKFGEATRRAVAQYQRANGLEATGVADSSTLMRLFESDSVSYDEYVVSQCCVRGDSGAKVRGVQRRLNELGYFTGDSTGAYGDNTYRAVALFQKDNGLPESGNVDVVTYEALFDPNAEHAVNDGALNPGDSGDRVYAMQQRLMNLGFYTSQPDGVYDRETETAVMLFCAANGLGIAPDADGQVLGALYSDGALNVSALEGSAEAAAPEQIAEVCALARSLVGSSFPDEGGLLTGFGFVQYVFAGCGVAISDPSEAIANLADAADTVLDMAPGNILVLGHGDAESRVLRFAICAGEGRIIYVDQESGVVVDAAFDSVEYQSAYAWKLGL